MARPAGRGCGCGPTWSAPATAWPRPRTSANRAGSRPSSPCSNSTSARKPGGSDWRVSTSAAEPFSDSVGVGSYRIDLHPSTGGINYIDISSLPFQVPLGALIPRASREPAAGLQEPRNDPHHQWLLPAPSRGMGHRRGGRGTRGILPRNRRLSPRACGTRRRTWRAFQSRLMARGVEIAWPKLTPR